MRQAVVVCVLAGWYGLACSPYTALAQVPRIQGQGTAASAMGNAFAAQADDPSAIHYNPAGLTRLHGVEFMGGLLLSGGTTRFIGPTGVTATGDRNGSLAWPPPAHLYLTANLQDLGLTILGPLSLGIGVTSPFGSLMRWPTDGPFRSATIFNTLPLLDIKPTMAYEVTHDLSLGMGADIYTFSGLLGEGQVERQSIWPGGFGIPAGARIELFGADTTAGFNVSVLYTAIRNSEGQPLINVGLVYRSQAILHLSGALLANGTKVSDAKATLVLPPVITGAVAVWPYRTMAHEWKVELNIDHVGWHVANNLDVHLANGATIPQPLSWQNTYAVMVGTEYKWLAIEALPSWDVALRAGYTHQPTQMPDFSFDPGVPSADANIVGGGMGFLCRSGGKILGLVPCGQVGVGRIRTQGIGLDLSYQASLYDARTIAGNRNPTVNGAYRTTLHTGGLSLRLLF